MFQKTISEFIENQFPAIFREDGEDVIAFLEAYYEFLQERTRGVGQVRSMFEYGDVDLTLDQFVKYFSEKYLNNLPNVSATDRRFLIKHVQDIYSTRGSEKSVELLMRLIFNEGSSVYRPDTDVFRASDSQWKQPFYIELSYHPKNETFVNKMIQGSASGSTAIVEALVRKRVSGKVIDIAYVTNIKGNFLHNEKISIDGDVTDTPSMIGSLSSIDITLGGGNFRVGDILSVNGADGKQAKVRVTAINNATGRVSFELLDGGFGYTLSSVGNSPYEYASDIYISDAVLVVDNPDLKFRILERVEQAKVEMQLISALAISTQGWQPGDKIIGKNSSGDDVATGTIYSMINLDSAGLPSSDPQSNVNVSAFIESGSFLKQYEFTVDSTSSMNVGKRIREGSRVRLVLDSMTGTFTVGTWVRQNHVETVDGVSTVVGIAEGVIQTTTGSEIELNPSFGTFRVGIPLSAVTSGGTGIVQDAIVLETGASAIISAVPNSTTLVVSEVNGVFGVGSKIKQENGTSIATISALSEGGVTDVVLSTNNSASGVVLTVQDKTSAGIVVGQNTNAVGICGNTSPFEMLSAVPTQMFVDANDLSANTWAKINASVTSTPLEGISTISVVESGLTDSYVYQTRNFINGTSYRFFTSVTSTSQSTVVFKFPSAFRTDNSSDGIVVTIDTSNGEMIVYGPQTTIKSIRVRENTLAGYDFDVTLTAQRNAPGRVQLGSAIDGYGGISTIGELSTVRSLILHEETQLYYGNIITKRDSDNFIMSIMDIGTGSGASFEITGLENQETISTNTDIIGSTNITGYITYPEIRIDGSGSGVGIVSSYTISNGGTGYSNGSAVLLTGGGYDGSTPFIPSEGIIATDAAGTITNITVTNPGSGYFSAPIVSLPATSGTQANVSADMTLGYGFPKAPFAGLNSLIIEALTIDTMTIGTISGIGKINPGQNYNMAPFLLVRNKWVAGFDRKDIRVNISNASGIFSTGELVQQQVPDPNTPGSFGTAKGIVRVATADYVILKRTSFTFSVTPGYPLIGQTSGVSALVENVGEQADSLIMGENAIISSNVVTANGTIRQVEVIDSGYGYRDKSEVELHSDTNISIAIGITSLRNQGIGEGFWQTTTSHPSDNKYLQDSYFYQTHSYQIRSPIVLDKYQKILEKVIHISGTKMFGEIMIDSFNALNMRVVYGGVISRPASAITNGLYLNFTSGDYIVPT